ncbi:Trehalose utilization [Pseudobythopirellula maris]|uniref:Trehalose utilization n=1 Tax=Pseudobythopirellula maris TaxID=2527991 RepID=A0A5C5ZXS9_9BACT|nr:ThuA domain-containing protein [Pseudobythopirellula maris]TWT91073.1 Trehalose utilization [Pseudobythopirellula maris]
MPARPVVSLGMVLSVLTAVWLTPSAACRAQEPSFRMPVYSTRDAVPPPRTTAEVDRLLEGASDPAAEPEAPLRVLLVAGEKDHGPGEHDYPNWQEVWARLLARAPRTEVDTAWGFPDAEQIEASDVIVFYQRGRWDEARAAAIDPHLARGRGLVYIHWAIDGRGGQEAFAERIGMASLGGAIRYRHGLLDIDFAPGKDHPIARNFDRVRWTDEAYWKLTGDPEKLDLLGTSTEDGEPTPQFWTVRRGRGRVFVSVPGHYAWTFDDPLFRTLLLRGVAWAGGRGVDRFNGLVTLDARVE